MEHYNRNVPLTNDKEGLEQRKQLLSNITDDGMYLPKPIDYDDIDLSTKNFVDKNLSITIEGVKVPVYFLTIQRWSEFTRTWNNSNEFKDLELPFISIVREPDIQPGNNQDGLFDVAGFPTFFYHKVPTFKNGREGYDLYKIPQPTSCNITYHVRVFTNRLIELNKIQNKVQRTFKSKQFYIDVLGHPMPILLENVADESKIDDIQSRRYYGLDFEMVVNGYIINEDDFEVTPMIDRSLLVFENNNTNLNQPKLNKKINRNDKTIHYNIMFMKNTKNHFTYTFNENVSTKSITPKISNDYEIILNGSGIDTLPTNFNVGDKIDINIPNSIKNTFNIQIKAEII